MADFKSLYNGGTPLKVPIQGGAGYQNITKNTENTLVTQNTVGMLSFPDHPNFQFEDEEQKEEGNNDIVPQQRRGKYLINGSYKNIIKI